MPPARSGVHVDWVAEVDPVVDVDRIGDRVPQAAVAGRVGRDVVIAVGRVSADEVDRVVHPEAVVAGVLAVEAELALDRRRRRGTRGDRVDLVDLALLGEHHHLA